MECPHCKKTFELAVVGERPWWKDLGCLIPLVFVTIFVVYELFFTEKQEATKEDTAKLDQRLQAIERVMDEISQKLNKLSQPPEPKP